MVLSNKLVRQYKTFSLCYNQYFHIGHSSQRQICFWATKYENKWHLRHVFIPHLYVIAEFFVSPLPLQYFKPQGYQPIHNSKWHWHGVHTFLISEQLWNWLLLLLFVFDICMLFVWCGSGEDGNRFNIDKYVVSGIPETINYLMLFILLVQNIIQFSKKQLITKLKAKLNNRQNWWRRRGLKRCNISKTSYFSI